MTETVHNVLFLCTGNSARSILAEGILRRDGAGRFRAFSAGSHPKGAVHKLALQVLARFDCPTEGMRSKSWDEFARPGAPTMDFVFTVCDQAGGEVCPIWPGHPMTAHWGIDDPASAKGPAPLREAAFVTAFRLLRDRIGAFVNLPFGTIDAMALRAKLRDIGAMDDASAKPPVDAAV